MVIANDNHLPGDFRQYADMLLPTQRPGIRLQIIGYRFYRHRFYEGNAT